MLNVLMVQNDFVGSQLCALYLSQVPGFKLKHCTQSGTEALGLLKQYKYDLIIMDVVMGGMDGVEFLTQVRARGYDVDVIVVSAAVNKDQIKQSLRLGAVDYVVKPFEFARFRQALETYRHRQELTSSQTVLQQFELDSSLMSYRTDNFEFLPKGLNRQTLDRVWEAISQWQGMFTAADVSAQLGLSRVTIRKYLNLLTENRFLGLDLFFGNVGRPVSRYKILKGK